MKKTHTFKNYVIDGIEETYNMKVSVKDYILTITETFEENRKEETKYLLEEISQGISKEEAEEYLLQFFSMTIELEEI
jgi:hypothetical protein